MERVGVWRLPTVILNPDIRSGRVDTELGVCGRWRGRVALVTGASAGIGWSTCELLAEAGMRVVAVARRRERLEALQQHLVSRGVPIADFLPVVCDITKVRAATAPRAPPDTAELCPAWLDTCCGCRRAIIPANLSGWDPGPCSVQCCEAWQLCRSHLRSLVIWEHM